MKKIRVRKSFEQHLDRIRQQAQERREREHAERQERWRLVDHLVEAYRLGIHAQAFVYDTVTDETELRAVQPVCSLARAQQTAGVFDLLPYGYETVEAKNLTDQHQHRDVMWFPQRGWAEPVMRVALAEDAGITRITLTSVEVKPPVEPGSELDSDWARQYPDGAVLITGRPREGALHEQMYAIPGDWDVYLKVNG